MHTPKVASHMYASLQKGHCRAKLGAQKASPSRADYFRSGKVDVRMFSAWNVGKILQGKLSLRRHMLACHTKQCDEQGMMLLCPECGHTFTNQSCFRKHMQLAHTKEKYGCALCGFMTPQQEIPGKAHGNSPEALALPKTLHMR
ncbi:hypothetical protein BaRGS_00013557 [Batillaria attramentaria]|uniref:C2H2-type domain-containing protein n=1 Tax=Batillaria attramentaria TaxID=370345 RepID=A0ABD0L7K1_9CAEN